MGTSLWRGSGLFLSFFIVLSFSCQREAGKRDSDVTKEHDYENVTRTTTVSWKDLQAIKIDSLLDDFLLYYTANDSFQHVRTRFPLPCVDKEGKLSHIEVKDWQRVRFLTMEKMYSLLLNSQDDMDLASSTNLREGVFEWIYPQKDEVVQYFFQRTQRGAWYLDSLAINHIADNPNAGFWEFYRKFATDVRYQAKHVRPNILLLTNSMEDGDGYTTEVFSVGLEQWLAWQIELPVDTLTHIVYGKYDELQIKNSIQKILCYKSVDESMFRALYFRKDKRGEWQLYQYEDSQF